MRNLWVASGDHHHRDHAQSPALMRRLRLRHVDGPDDLKPVHAAEGVVGEETNQRPVLRTCSRTAVRHDAAVEDPQGVIGSEAGRHR